MKELKDEVSFTLTEAYVEKDGVGEKRLQFEGIFSESDNKNKNNRVYKKGIWETNLKEGSSFKSRLDKRAVLGELEHPESGTTSLKRVSHQFLEAKLQEDGKVWAKGQVLNTPDGRILAELFAVKYPVGASSRGNGTSTQDKDENIEEVNEDYVLDTWDFVYDPSVECVETHLVDESRMAELSESEDSVVTIFESYGCRDGDVACVVEKANKIERKDSVIILKDGKEVAKAKDINDALKKLHGLYSGSWKSAFKYEGYTFVYEDGTPIPMESTETEEVCVDCIIKKLEKASMNEIDKILCDSLSKLSSNTSGEVVDAIMKAYKRRFNEETEQEVDMAEEKTVDKNVLVIEKLVKKAADMKERAVAAEEKVAEMEKNSDNKNTSELEARLEAAKQVINDQILKIEELEKKYATLEERYGVAKDLTAEALSRLAEQEDEEDDDEKDKDKDKDKDKKKPPMDKDKEKDDEDKEESTEENADETKSEDEDKSTESEEVAESETEEDKEDNKEEDNQEGETKDEESKEENASVKKEDTKKRTFSKGNAPVTRRSAFMEAVDTYESRIKGSCR